MVVTNYLLKVFSLSILIVIANTHYNSAIRNFIKFIGNYRIETDVLSLSE